MAHLPPLRTPIQAYTTQDSTLQRLCGTMCCAQSNPLTTEHSQDGKMVKAEVPPRTRSKKRKTAHMQRAQSGEPLTYKIHKAVTRHTQSGQPLYAKRTTAIHKADNRYTQSGQPLYTKRTTATHKADNRSHTRYTKHSTAIRKTATGFTRKHSEFLTCHKNMCFKIPVKKTQRKLQKPRQRRDNAVTTP